MWRGLDSLNGRFSRISSAQLLRSGAEKGMGLLWCSRGKPARLLGPDADRSGCAAQATSAECGAVRIGSLSPRGLEAKM